MTMILYRLIAVVSLAVLPSTFGAQLSTFVGTWTNIDPNTRGLTTLHIALVGADVKLEAWGKCVPKDCPWGETEGTAYGSRIDANASQDVRVISAHFTSKITETLFVVHVAPNDRVQVDVLKRYTDHSGRANTSEVAVLTRVVGHSP
jgi:hypothetical protein